MPFGDLRALLVLNNEAKAAKERLLYRGRKSEGVQEAIYRSAFLQTIALLSAEGEHSGLGSRTLEFYDGITENFGSRDYDAVQKLLEKRLKKGQHIPDKHE
jgi:hypothetical protein